MSVFVVSAYVCFFAGAAGRDPAFSFCALLTFAASLAAAAVILNRHYERRARLPPAQMNGRPSYNSVQSNSPGDVASLGFPSVFYRVTVCLACTDFGVLDELRATPPAAYVGYDLAFGGNVLIRDLVLRRAEDLPHTTDWRSRAVVCGRRLWCVSIFLFWSRAPAIRSAPPSRRNTPSRGDTPISGSPSSESFIPLCSLRNW